MKTTHIQGCQDNTWAYTLSDYRSIFALTDEELGLSLLDYPAGISSVNAELFAKGQTNLVSADRRYGLSPMDMMKHVDVALQSVSEGFDHTLGKPFSQMPHALSDLRAAAGRFLQDYSVGQRSGRYQVARLPTLPFRKGQFKLALCSNLLFRTPEFSALEVANALLQVAEELRVFPLLDASKEVAADLGPLLLHFQQLNYGVEVKAVDTPWHIQGNAMLRVWNKACEVVVA